MAEAAAKSKLLKIVSWVLIIGGIVGILASGILTIDELKIAKDPSFKPSCSINPIISCGSVMTSDQAHIFGFPNPVIGLATFGALAAIGAALIAGARFKRWFWLGVQAGTLFGAIFVHWLFFQTVYRINALCLYCIAIWIVTIAGFWYVTLYNLEQGHIKAPKQLKRIAGFAQRHHVDILITWYLVITVLILNHFWYYFKTLF